MTKWQVGQQGSWHGVVGWVAQVETDYVLVRFPGNQSEVFNLDGRQRSGELEGELKLV